MSSWRFNNRQNQYLFRDALMRLLDAETLRDADLISETDQHN